MIATIVLLAQVAAIDAVVVEKGAELYRLNCAVAFCHGSAGAAGRAPALAGRNFEPEALRRAISHGILNRGMPAFHKQLGDQGVDAVFAYVRSLRGTGPVATTPIKLTKEVRPGRELFFDSSRFPGCSDCHTVGSMGAAIATKLKPIAGAQALRAVRASQVKTVQVRGEPAFPGIVSQATPELVRVYDLSAPLPVLRTFVGSDVALKDGSGWSHSLVVGRYTERELELILDYIRALK